MQCRCRITTCCTLCSVWIVSCCSDTDTIPGEWNTVSTYRGILIDTDHTCYTYVQCGRRITTCCTLCSVWIVSCCSDTDAVPGEWNTVSTYRGILIDTDHTNNCHMQGRCRITTCCTLCGVWIVSCCCYTDAVPGEWNTVSTNCCVLIDTDHTRYTYV